MIADPRNDMAMQSETASMSRCQPNQVSITLAPSARLASLEREHNGRTAALFGGPDMPKSQYLAPSSIHESQRDRNVGKGDLVAARVKDKPAPSADAIDLERPDPSVAIGPYKHSIQGEFGRSRRCCSKYPSQ